MKENFVLKCGARLEYSYYQYSPHIGKFHCSKCDFQTPEMDICLKDIDLDKETFSSDGIHYKSPYEGMYSMYNCAVVLNVAKNYGISQDCVKSVFSHAPQPAGRNENIHIKGTDLYLNLVKILQEPMKL